MGWRTGRVGATALVALAVAMSSAAGANSQPADFERMNLAGPKGPRELVHDPQLNGEVQLSLPPVHATTMQYATELQREHRRAPGFGGVRISDDRSTLTIYWHGKQPRSLQEAATLAPSGLAIQVASTPYARSALRSEARRLLQASQRGVGPEIVSVGPNSDNTGLIVEVAGDGSLQTSSTSTMSELTDFPVEVRHTEGLDPAVWRWEDSSPFWGGGRIYQVEGGACSTAFAVQNASTDGMLTAAHCGDVGDAWRTNPGVAYGTQTGRETDLDSAVITGQGYSGAIYWGSHLSSQGVPIDGAADPILGNELCFSGAYSGTVCGAQVTDTDVLYSLGGDLTSVTGFRHQRLDGTPVFGNGDSGGPGVLPITVAGGTVDLWASTIISAIPLNSPETCTGVPGGNGRRCSSTGYSTSAVDSADAMFGMTIRNWS